MNCSALDIYSSPQKVYILGHVRILKRFETIDAEINISGPTTLFNVSQPTYPC